MSIASSIMIVIMFMVLATALTIYRDINLRLLKRFIEQVIQEAATVSC